MVRLRPYQAILLDHRLPDDDGIRIIPLLLASQPDTAVVMMTAFETIPNAIRAIRRGATDYLVKQTSVLPIVERVLEIRMQEEVRSRIQGWSNGRRPRLLGQAPAIELVRGKIRKVARSALTTVLFSGESGVGKEVAARELHERSGDPGRPFITVDCLALPDNLVESLLFGHEKGAFTGADHERDGAFHEAGTGSIFLDEIGEMELTLQGKLLRVLESRTYQRVGSVASRRVDARVIAATNQDLRQQVEAGRFRFDLYQRLSVFPIDVPPLATRREDVPLLVRHFLDDFCAKLDNPHNRLSDDVLELLYRYDYPGNVRELRNIMERAVIMAEGHPIGLEHLPERLLRITAGSDDDSTLGSGVPFDYVAGVDTLESVEKKMIVRALEQTGGVKSEAAELLGISRFQLGRRIEKYKLGH